MYYEINVSHNGAHFFATSDHSILTERQLKRVYDALVKAFPEHKGYHITVTKYDRYGTEVDGYPFV